MNEENEILVEYLASKLKQQIEEAEELYDRHKKGKFSRPVAYGNLSPLTMVMLFYSYYYFDDYGVYAKEYAYANQLNGNSGCTAVFCGTSDSSNDSNGGKGCSSSCSGSCSSSSCGGGCSS